MGLFLCLTLLLPACALTDAEAQAAVDAQGKGAVAGNFLIWFLCAIAFLKVSQKIDSLMAALGVNVGRTGSSLIAEAMIAFRGASTVAGAVGKGLSIGGGYKGATGTNGANGGPSWFMQGGLAGVVSRSVTNKAVKTATGTTSAVHTASSSSRADHFSTAGSSFTERQAATDSQRQTATDSSTAISRQSSKDASRVTQAHTATQSGASTVTRQDSSSRAAQSSQSSRATRSSKSEQAKTAVHRATSAVTRAATSVAALHRNGIGGTMFNQSIQTGGQFANDVIGRVARGDIRSTGSMTGEMAAQAMMSYTGQTALGDTATQKISFSDMEIGGGRITGTEITPEHPEGMAFGMYHVDQYAAPKGDYTKVFTADGTQWYKQYATDTVVQTPYKAPDGEVDYHKEIVKKLPDPPKRKDRL